MENRQVRIVQPNLLYVFGVQRKEDMEELRRDMESYGPLQRFTDSVTNSYQGSSRVYMSAYVTFRHKQHAIEVLVDYMHNKRTFKGRSLKISMGTTKYCDFYLRRQRCLNKSCMFIHHQVPQEQTVDLNVLQRRHKSDYQTKLVDEFLASKNAWSSQQEQKARSAVVKQTQDKDCSTVTAASSKESSLSISANNLLKPVKHEYRQQTSPSSCSSFSDGSSESDWTCGIHDHVSPVDDKATWIYAKLTVFNFGKVTLPACLE